MKRRPLNNAQALLAFLRTNKAINEPRKKSTPLVENTEKAKRQKAMAEVLNYWLSSDGSKDTSTSMKGNADNASWRGEVAKELIKKGINDRQLLEAFLTAGSPKRQK